MRYVEYSNIGKTTHPQNNNNTRTNARTKKRKRNTKASCTYPGRAYTYADQQSRKAVKEVRSPWNRTSHLLRIKSNLDAVSSAAPSDMTDQQGGRLWRPLSISAFGDPCLCTAIAVPVIAPVDFAGAVDLVERVCADWAHIVDLSS